MSEDNLDRMKRELDNLMIGMMTPKMYHKGLSSLTNMALEKAPDGEGQIDYLLMLHDIYASTICSVLVAHSARCQEKECAENVLSHFTDDLRTDVIGRLKEFHNDEDIDLSHIVGESHNQRVAKEILAEGK